MSVQVCVTSSGCIGGAKGLDEATCGSTTLRVKMVLLSKVQATGKKPREAALQLSPSVAIKSARWCIQDMTTGRIGGV
jgi:hypothetical protein